MAKQPMAKQSTDGTLVLLERMGLSVTRENYLKVAFLGNPPDELDGEIEAEIEDVRDSLPTADWDETVLPLTKRDRKLLRQMGISK